jgi:hypothetical protein
MPIISALQGRSKRIIEASLVQPSQRKEGRKEGRDGRRKKKKSGPGDLGPIYK